MAALSDYFERATDVWAKWYEEEAVLLCGTLPLHQIARISHVGSTAAPGILAKPIIDILVELQPAADLNGIKKLLLQNGYRSISEEPRRISLNKGYSEQGFAEKVFHLHLRFSGDNDELYFRDYLRDHPEIAQSYEALKSRLRDRYEHNRDAYTEDRTKFITEYTQKARSGYGTRYGG
ncbi:MAG: GrpB family protein [Oscillospiraceae bacterium]|nr:GrpB family protein [Oscillospiraceae bacterium]